MGFLKHISDVFEELICYIQTSIALTLMLQVSNQLTLFVKALYVDKYP